eukprot:1898335-Amphidinium_carterae.1
MLRQSLPRRAIYAWHPQAIRSNEMETPKEIWFRIFIAQHLTGLLKNHCEPSRRKQDNMLKFNLTVQSAPRPRLTHNAHSPKSPNPASFIGDDKRAAPDASASKPDIDFASRMSRSNRTCPSQRKVSCCYKSLSTRSFSIFIERDWATVWMIL